MSWIAPRPDRRPPWHVRLFLWFLERRGGASESVRLWARTPRVLYSFLSLFKAVDRDASPLEPALRALVMVRVSQGADCPFCVDLNGSRALERGVTDAQLEALPDHARSPRFGPREKAALAFADAVTAGGAVTAELRRALRAAFSDDEIVELAALVAFQNMSARFNSGLDVPAEGRCAMPDHRGKPASRDA